MRRVKRRGIADIIVFFAVFGAFVFGANVGDWVNENVGDPFEAAAEWVNDVLPPVPE